MTSSIQESSWRISRVVLARDNLFDAETVLLFKRVFLRALGWTVPEAAAAGPPPTEAERLRVVPLVFGLIPSRALVRAKRDERIKPHIREHLTYIGLAPDEGLIDIIKAVADQYYTTQSEGSLGASVRPRKYGISDIKALNHKLYQQILKRQNRRCAICGIVLSRATEETLDHILPWRLVGDVPTGANWQILCQECNSGKQAWFSALQSPQAMNWVYGRHDQPIPSDRPTLETRYVVLAQYGICQSPGCALTPASSRLSLWKVHKSGLAIADNLSALCETHTMSVVAPSPS
jgi:5-methylcytosine-specific restriction endonuclease McrA